MVLHAADSQRKSIRHGRRGSPYGAGPGRSGQSVRQVFQIRIDLNGLCPAWASAGFLRELGARFLPERQGDPTQPILVGPSSLRSREYGDFRAIFFPYEEKAFVIIKKLKKRSFRIRGEVGRYPGPPGWSFVNTGLAVAADTLCFEDLVKVGWGYIQSLIEAYQSP